MRFRQRGTIFELSAGFDDEEERAQTHGAEVAAEEGFAVGADIRDKTFESEDDGDTAEEEDEREEASEFARGHGWGVDRWGKLLPGDGGAKVDEHAGVEEEVEDVGEVGFARFLREPAVPGEAVAGTEGDEEVVYAEVAGDADCEDGEEEVED